MNMKAILVKEPGDVDQLYIGEFPKPNPSEDELLVKVKATALNRADLLQRRGKYPPPPGASTVIGLEMSGVVEDVGTRSTGWKPGDRVFGLLPGGGYSEFVTIHERMAVLIPENFSFEEAAAIPEVFMTAFQSLFWLGKLKEGERILIHAGGSGVGTAAIQLAREAGAISIVTAGSKGKLDACRKLGAAVTVNYKEGPFTPKVMDATEGRGVNLILDFIGAPYWEENVESLAEDGRIILIGSLGGTRVEQLDLRPVMKKRLQVTGTSLRSRSLNYKIRLTQEFSEFALPRFIDGRLKPVIHQILPWEEVKEAHQVMEGNKNIGKIVLKLP
jgi:putative PIG3 family NAD(P)H quinone oxidoreductase